MIDYKELQQYVNEHIPIVNALKFKIQGITQKEVKVQAPYLYHINHRNSVFGGSISSLLILAAWARVKCIMEEIDPRAIIVIQDSQVEYLKPVLEDFTAESKDLSLDLNKIQRMYQRFGKARLNIGAEIHVESKREILASFEGRFVVINPQNKTQD
ncbi:MAG: YiiD C-terminal domain-containing protein [Spirochaetaceae bacterium]|jgi:thioesterase domain-containing protein|nr:YiiD C-terminal domain-containing protein [Spirochaetaceae bacterium]